MAEGKAKEQTILETVREQEERLRMLLVKIDNLVERNPNSTVGKSTVGKSEEKVRPDNAFDEIINILNSCRDLIRETDEKVLLGISKKVQ